MAQRGLLNALSVLTLGLVWSGVAHADSMRCGNRLATKGDAPYKVRALCGAPDAATQRVEYRTVTRRVRVPCSREIETSRCEKTVERTVEVVLDEWTYDFGRNRFVHHLTFEQGKLVKVEVGGYGHK